jgi:hypothetical protein
VQWDDIRDPVTHYQDEFEDIKITITNALQAIHAISLKKGFAAEEIMSIREMDGLWLYKLSLDNRIEYSFKPE